MRSSPNDIYLQAILRMVRGAVNSRRLIQGSVVDALHSLFITRGTLAAEGRRRGPLSDDEAHG